MSPTRPALVVGAFAALATVSVASAAMIIDHPAEVTVQAVRVSPPPAAGPADQRDARELVVLVTRYRQSRGLPGLSWDDRVAAASLEQSAYQASIDRMTHQGPGGTSGGDRLTAQGYPWHTWGENVAMGYQSPAAVLDGWIASPAHRQIMLDPAYRVAGAAVVASASGAPYWTLDVAD